MDEIPLEDQLVRLAASFPTAKMALLPALQHAARKGELTPAVIAIVAQVCQGDEEAVWRLLEAYPELRGPARRITVCQGLSCWLMGASRILASPESYGLVPGEFDRTFCLGYCFAAPTIRNADGKIFHVEPPKEPSSVIHSS
jgi:NADH:ubiquinone oxidoreductase subunit E